MKTLKINSLKNLISLSFILVLFMSACSNAQNSTKETEVNTKETETAIANIGVDINTAVVTGNLEAVKKHIAAGTNIDEKDQMTGSTPLITPATFNKVDIVKVLIEAQADLSLKNNDGSTALHSAAFFGRIEVVQMLIDAKADKTIRNNFGATPRESVLGDFNDMKPIYEMLKKQLTPFGFELDMEELKKARPVIAMMLQ